MNLYLAIVSKSGLPISAVNPRIEHLVYAMVRKTMFDYVEPTQSVQYSNSGCCALFLFSLRGERLKSEDDAPIFRRYAIANTGYPMDGYEEMLKHSGCDKQYVSTLNGVFSLCVMDKQLDVVRAYNNHMRLENVFYGEDDEFYYVATRALLISALKSNGTYQLAEGCLTAFLHRGYFSCEGTAFEGVTETSIYSELLASSSGISQSPIEDLSNSYFKRNLTDEICREMAQDLIDACRLVRPITQDAVIGLTGGKDSRMMVLAMNAAGLSFSTETGGDKDSPDVLVAQRIASMLGVDHRVYNSAPWQDEVIEQNILLRTQKVLFSSDCMLYGFEGCARNERPYDSSTAVYNGLGGEILRGGYAKRLSKKTSKEVIGKVKRLYDTMPEFFHPEANAVYEQSYLKNFGIISTSEPESMDWVYVQEHMGKWASATMRCWNINRPYLTPLCDEQLIKKAMLLQTLDKINDDLIFRIIGQLDERFLKVPLADARWAFEKTGPRAGDEENYALREPVTAKTAKGAFSWRHQTLTDMRQAMCSVVFDKSCSGLFDYLKREAVEELFSEESKYLAVPYASVFAWNVYSAAVMLEGSWFQNHSDNRKGGFAENSLAIKPVRIAAPDSQPRSREDIVAIVKLRSEVEELTSKLDSVERHNSTLMLRDGQKQGRIKQLETEREKLRNKLDQLTEQCRENEKSIDRLNTSLDKMRRSRSWKMTAPLRKMNKRLHGR